MAFKLSAGEVQHLELLADGLDAERSKVEDAVRHYNETVAAAHEVLVEAIGGYNAGLEAARNAVADLQNVAQSEFDAKSNRWQQGERGEAVQDWIGEFENVASDLDDIEPDEPTELDIDSFIAANHAELLRGIAAAPEED